MRCVPLEGSGFGWGNVRRELVRSPVSMDGVFVAVRGEGENNKMVEVTRWVLSR